jgi:DNA-binding response OmpR family regulator
MNKHIMVVDDDEQIRHLLMLYFQKEGFQVTTAPSSAEGLRQASQEQPDLVLLDIGLAEEDGLKALPTFKSRFPGIKVVMLTGLGFVEDLLQEAAQKGADGYVRKGPALDELMATVNRVLKPARS